MSLQTLFGFTQNAIVMGPLGVWSNYLTEDHNHLTDDHNILHHFNISNCGGSCNQTITETFSIFKCDNFSNVTVLVLQPALRWRGYSKMSVCVWLQALLCWNRRAGHSNNGTSSMTTDKSVFPPCHKDEDVWHTHTHTNCCWPNVPLMTNTCSFLWWVVAHLYVSTHTHMHTHTHTDTHHYCATTQHHCKLACTLNVTSSRQHTWVSDKLGYHDWSCK